MTDRIVVGMTGATGQLYGIKALELLREAGHESHLILSNAAKVNVEHEADYSVAEVRSLADEVSENDGSVAEALADEVYDNDNVGARPASGTFRNGGMLIAPCSMKTLSNVAHGNSRNLIARAADVALKERRPLVVMPREKPFNRIHLENMLAVTDAGGVVMPPFPSYYDNPETIEETVVRTVARSLSFLDVDVDVDEWQGV